MKYSLLKHLNLPVADLSEQAARHVFVARGNQREWNGHPSTVLLPDGKTIFCVWQARRDGTRQHGAPGGYMKRSDDGGQTWSNDLALPSNWREIGRGAPTIHRLSDGQGKARLFVFCRDENRSIFLVGISEDDGVTWSELRPIGLAEPEAGPITGWTAPITILETTTPDGRLVIVFRPVPPGEAKTLSAYPDNFFTAWVGRYEDIVEGRENDCLVRLLRSYRGADHTYPELELLPDGTLVATTYIQYRPNELQSIVSVRFEMDDVLCRRSIE